MTDASCSGFHRSRKAATLHTGSAAGSVAKTSQGKLHPANCRTPMLCNAQPSCPALGRSFCVWDCLQITLLYNRICPTAAWATRAVAVSSHLLLCCRQPCSCCLCSAANHAVHGQTTRQGPCAWCETVCLLQHSIQAAGTALTFSSMKLRQPSLGTNAAIFLPFLISCTRAHFLMAELGCLASMPL